MKFDTLVQAAPAVEPKIDRVREHTPSKFNQKIDQATLKRVWRYSKASRPVLTARITELEKEWDLERAMETQMAGLSLAGFLLGATVHKRWLILPAAVMACLLQHSVKRRSLPMRILRSLGVRTRKEIEAEKYALKLLRGDFDRLNTIGASNHKAIEALRLARM